MISRLVCAALWLALLLSVRGLDAQTPVLVKDIWPGASGAAYAPPDATSLGSAAGLAYFASGFSFHGSGCGEILTTDGTSPLRLLIDGVCVSGRGADLDGRFFFCGTDQASGALWKTDGTTAGTTLVKRIAAGAPSISTRARLLTTVNARLWFSADDGVHGAELWASDGTEAGTAMVADATPGPTGTLDFSSSIVGVGSTVFFTSCTPVCSLWKSDGTASGTVPLANVAAASLASLGTTLYFIGNGEELWKSDGTGPGTLKIADAPFGAELTAVNGTLFFRACDSTNGCELWKSDGTGPGTGIVRDVTPGMSGYVSSFSALGNSVVFVSWPGSTVEIWRSDGTEGGTTLLGSMAGPALSSAVAGTKLLLLTTTQLWASDGTAAGTQVVEDVLPQSTSGAGPIPDFRMTVLGNVVTFGLKDAVGGSGVYRSDGSAAGTRPLGPLVAIPNSSSPGRLVDANGTLFFGADDGAHGFELWASDGTPEGTRLVKDINPTGSGFNRSPPIPTGNGVFFVGHTSAEGLELWRSDGTEAGTFLVKDIAPGPASSVPQIFGTRGEVVLFNASTDDNGVPSLWRSDGTEAGTFSLGGVRGWSPVVEWRGAAWFVGSYLGVYALWRTDATVAGTSAVAVIPGDNWNSVSVVRDTLVFSACDAAHGCEPWKSDGTPAGTGLLFDVNPGAADGLFAGQGYLPVGDLAMFWADDGVHGREPWVTDGTAAGTRLLADIFPGPATSAGIGTAAVGGLRFFAANDGAHGFELWKTDGTPEGTALVRDINPGAANSLWISSFMEGFHDVWFLATDGIAGEELWKSDGTAAGTLRMSDVFPGPGSSTISIVVSGFDRVRRSGARMYFVADDGTTGFELWSVPLPTTMHVITPCRLYDSRLSAAPLADGEVRRFAASGVCDIPTGAAQVVANVTVVDGTADGSVEVGPGGPVWTGLPVLSFRTGRTRANNTVFALGTDGAAAARLTAPSGSAHVVIDVSGYLQ